MLGRYVARLHGGPRGRRPASARRAGLHLCQGTGLHGCVSVAKWVGVVVACGVVVANIRRRKPRTRSIGRAGPAPWPAPLVSAQALFRDGCSVIVIRTVTRLPLKPWARLNRFHFSRANFLLFDLFHYFVRVNWPEATALLDKLVDDSPQLLFFSIIEHSNDLRAPYFLQDSTSYSKSLSAIRIVP